VRASHTCLDNIPGVCLTPLPILTQLIRISLIARSPPKQDDPVWNEVIEAGLVREVREYLERNREAFKLGASRAGERADHHGRQ
jgi:hypothetical protein